MACAEPYCQDYGTGTTTCNQHRAACATNRTLAGTTPATNVKVQQFDVEDLRTKIMQEIDRFNDWQTANSLPTYTKNDPGAFATGQLITNDLYNAMEQTLSNINDPGTVANDGTLMDASIWNALFNSYNTVRQDCICNSDCSCNNVCVCHNDCGCNYSDIRLKENIQFINTTNGVNVYSWNYIWDKTRTYVGVLAQEILGTKYADAVTTDSNGFYMVNYKKLPI